LERINALLHHGSRRPLQVILALRRLGLVDDGELPGHPVRVQ